MKRIILFSILSFTAASAFAYPDYEPFNYPSGVNLVGQTNPDGLTWAAAGPPGVNVGVQAGSLTVPGLAPSIGNQILFQGATGPSARFPIGPVVNQGTVFFSFALRVTDLTRLTTTGDYLAGFNDVAGTQSTTPTVVGTRVLTRALAAGGGYNLGLSKSSDLPADFKWDPRVFTVNDTVFIVGRYAFSDLAVDLADLWINPNPADFGAATPPPSTFNSSAGTDLLQIASFIFFQRPQGVQPSAAMADELRIGSTWAAVTPPAVPPPPNDQCGGAIVLSCGSSYSMSTSNATSLDDPVPTCAQTFGKGVWFSFTPANSGPVTFSTCGSTFDTVLQVYMGLCGPTSLVPVSGGCNDDNGPACAGTQASVTINGIANTVYHVLVGGFGGASGDLIVSLPDTVPPQIICPSNITLTTDAGQCSRGNVAYTVTATDNCALREVICNPPSGSTFPKGVTTVTCTATDTSSNRASCTFTVTIRDTEPPRVSCPNNLVYNTDPGQCSKSNVLFTATATDNCPGVTVSCNPPSGSIFPKGMTTVICTATDASGNTNQCSFTVTVRDIQPPRVTCPNNIVLGVDPGQCSKSNVTWTATATDNCPGVNVSCNPPTGSTFPKGVTMVVCSATDASGNTSSCSFTVTIRDVIPPVVRCPADITVSTTNPAGRVVQFLGTATDNCDPMLTVNCTPPSGSVFPIGTTRVTCSTCDSSTNCATCSFTVTVVLGSGPDLEIDYFPTTLATVQLCLPNGQTETLTLSGPTTVEVSIGPVGECADTDGDGRDQVPTRMTQLELNGVSPTLGPVTLSLRSPTQHPFLATVGEIEEMANAHPGILDIRPFEPAGLCESFFDVFFEVKVAGNVLHNHQPKQMRTVIDHKPPGGGTSYGDPTPIPLFDANENPTGISLCATRHIPESPPPEIDHFENTLAQVTICLPNGNTENLTLSGPTTVEVSVGPSGECGDTDSDGRDQARTVMTQLDLSGVSPTLGPVTLNLRNPAQHPFLPTAGEIEEQVNAHPGILDIRPFEPSGLCDSFFDVFFEVKVAGNVLHNHQAKRMRTVIDYKPPGGGTAYEDPVAVPLFDQNENPTGISLCATRHIPQPPLPEVDHFENTAAVVDICLPDGSSQTVTLNGPTTVEVFIGPAGECADTDSNGRDQARTLMTQMSLNGVSPTLGTVQLGLRDPLLHPFRTSGGQIEEQVNAHPGILDIQPFEPSGLCDSFFDVFFEVKVAGQVLHNHQPKRMRTVINHKPPGPGTAYEDPTPIPLFDANENPTGISLCASRHIPQTPPPEIDHFPTTLATVQLCLPNGQTENLTLSGPTTVEVFIGPAGQCSDTDSDGRDQARTLMTQMSLSGTSPMLGPVQLGLRDSLNHPFRTSGGELEEQVNSTPGILDIRPFRPTGLCDSFFDVFFEVKVAGMVMHNHQPKRMQTIIDYKPPGMGAPYEDPTRIPLFDEYENPTGVSLCVTRHRPAPPEIDYFEYSLAQMTLRMPDGRTETVNLAGPTTVEVAIPPDGQASDTDGDGRDQVKTEMTQLDLHGSSSMGSIQVHLDPTHQTLGELEERVNATVGTLDLPPFTPTGTADSFFDVFAEVVVNGIVLHPAQPVHLQTVITHKPPAPDETYLDPLTQPVELLDANGRPTGIYLVHSAHTPNPRREIDYSPMAEVTLTVQLPTGGKTNLFLRGPTTTEVYIPPNGHAVDTDGDGRDQVPARLIQMDLHGHSPLGPASFRLASYPPSIGEIEERVNFTPDTLDVPPFTATGTADSFFDVFYELELGGVVLHPAQPIHLQTVLTHKPPPPGAGYTNAPAQPMPLLDTNGELTGFQLLGQLHIPEPPPCPSLDISLVRDTQVDICWRDDGRDCVLVSTSDLTPPVKWLPVDLPVIILPSGDKCVSVTNLTKPAFFRLCGGCP